MYIKYEIKMDEYNVDYLLQFIKCLFWHKEIPHTVL